MKEVYKRAICRMLESIKDEDFLRKIYTLMKAHEKRRG